MSALITRCAPLIDRAAPSLTPAFDLTNSDSRSTFWELWDGRLRDAPTVAKYAVNPDGSFRGGAIITGSDLLGMPTLADFLRALREIEERS